MIALFIISVAVYVNTLQNGFVYDDAWQVLKNSWIRNVRFIPEIMSSDVWSFSPGPQTNYYRPMMHLLYMLVYHVSGLDPRAFHLLNVLLNAVVCSLVFMTTAKLLHQFRPSTEYPIIPAFAAAVLFATHPAHTEAVAWIAGVPDISYSLFCLLSFYLYARSREGARGAYALSVAAFLLAMFSKEPAILFLIVLMAYDHCLGKSRGESLVNIRRYVPFAAAAAVYLVARVLALGQLSQPVQQHRLDAFSQFINIFPLFGAYLAKLIVPWDLNAYTVFTPISSLLTIRGGFALISAVIFILLLVFSYRKNNIVFLGLLLIAIPLLPSLYIPVLPDNMFAERYLYFPSFGFVLLISSALTFRENARSWLFYSVGIMVVTVLYSIGTVGRNAVWKNDVTFYQDVLKKSPSVAMMHVNLGWTYYGMGRHDDALKEYRMALTINPNLAEAHNNIGMVYERQGLNNDAILEYRAALARKSNYPEAHINLGNVYLRVNLIDRAIEEYQAALRLSPRFTSAHYNLGNAFARSGKLDEAVREYQSAIELDPQDVDARNNLGVAYINLNRVQEAIEQFQAALRIAPGYLPARQNLQRVSQQRMP